MIQDYSVRNEFSIYNAKKFINSVNDEKLYLFLGRTKEWADELDPPTPTSSEQEMISGWDNMIVTKRMSVSDFSLACVKNVWESGVVYQPWDSDDGLLYNKKFFVITSDNRVYKCLDRIPNTPSTIEPTDTGVSPIRLSDGYTWKFMYDISSTELNKFKDTEVIPIKEVTADDGSLQWQVQQYAIPGTINHIEVLEGGSGYPRAPIVTITGDGTGATAQAVLDGNTIKYIIVTNMGRDYTWAKVTVENIGSVTAQLRAIISPIKGHGSNAVEELYGCSVISTTTFENDEGGKFPTDIKFRQIGIIANPYIEGSTTIADLSGANSQFTRLQVSGLSGTFVEGEYLNNTTSGQAAVAQVMKIESNTVYVNNIKGKISDNDQLQGATSGTSCEVIHSIPGVLEPYTGQMLYIENRPPIAKVENQSETYRLVIKF